MAATSDISCYRVYRGAGSASRIDYTSPIATLAAEPPGAAMSVQIPPVPGGWPAGLAWFITVRAVGGDGVEYADPSAVVRVEFDADGQLLPPRPAAVLDLAARPTSGQRLRVAWRFVRDERGEPPAEFELFLAAADSTSPSQTPLIAPAAVVPAGRSAPAHSYAWTSGPLAPGRWRVAVRGVSAGGHAGPARLTVASVRAGRVASVNILLAENC